MRKCLHYVRKHPRVFVSLVLFLGLVTVNGLAFVHAYSMSHFVNGGEKTSSPEALSMWQKGKVLLTGVRVPRPVDSHTPEDQGLKFEVRRFRGAAGTKYEAWYIPCRNSQGLCVLFHGYAECKSCLLPEAHAWRELGYDTLLVDFRGCGGSSGSVTTIGFCEADDVAAAVEYARQAITAKKPVLFGRSMGSVAILRAIAAGNVEPRAAVVECPFDTLLSTVENRFSSMGVPSFPCAHLLVFWGGIQHGYWGFNLNPVEYARNIRCPVLLVHGDRDPRVTKRQAEAVFDNLAGPKRLVVFANVGHEPCIAQHAAQWRNAVADFLAERR